MEQDQISIAPHRVGMLFVLIFNISYSTKHGNRKRVYLLIWRMNECPGGNAPHVTGYRKLTLTREFWAADIDLGVESDRQSKIPRWTHVSENSSGLNTDPGEYELEGERERSPKIQRRKSQGGAKMISTLQKSKTVAPRVGVISIIICNRDVQYDKDYC